MSKLTPLQATAPRKIWLQISDDAEHHAEPFPREAEITWCEDSVTACQVGYVREDLAQPDTMSTTEALPELPKPKTNVKELVGIGDCDFFTANQMRDYARAALAAAAPSPADPWLPIETAPRGTKVLLHAPGLTVPHCGDWGEYYVYNSPGYSHWMPLPAAPGARPAPTPDERIAIRDAAYQQGVDAMALQLREILDGRPVGFGSIPPELDEVAKRLAPTAQPVAPPKASALAIRGWAQRHDIGTNHLGEMREAFEDAQTWHLSGAAPTPPAASMKCPHCTDGVMHEHRMMVCETCNGGGVMRHQLRANAGPSESPREAAPYYISGPYPDGSYGMCESATLRILFQTGAAPMLNGLTASETAETASIAGLTGATPEVDWKLPGDFVCRGATFRKGVRVSTVISRMERLFDAAYPGVANLTQEQKDANLAALRGEVPAEPSAGTPTCDITPEGIAQACENSFNWLMHGRKTGPCIAAPQFAEAARLLRATPPARDAQADTAIIRAARNIQHSLFHDGPGDAVLALRDQLLPLLAGALEDCGYLPDLQRAAREAGLSLTDAEIAEVFREVCGVNAIPADFELARTILAAAQAKHTGEATPTKPQHVCGQQGFGALGDTCPACDSKEPGHG